MSLSENLLITKPLPLSLQDLQNIYTVALKECEFIQKQLRSMKTELDFRMKPSSLVSVRFNNYEAFFISFLDHLKYSVSPLCIDPSFPITNHSSLKSIIEINYKHSGIAHPILEEEINPLFETVVQVISNLKVLIEEIEKVKLKSIFLSHTSLDKPFVRKLAKDLIYHGAKVWIDEAEIKIGDSLIQKIEEGINQSDFLGAILSKASVKARWVQVELEMAITMQITTGKVKVLPILIEPCEIPGFLIGKLYADFSSEEKYDESLEKLLTTLKS